MRRFIAIDLEDGLCGILDMERGLVASFRASHRQTMLNCLDELITYSGYADKYRWIAAPPALSFRAACYRAAKQARGMNT